MSEIIPTLHPVPVRHYPRRGAHERLAHLRTVTPVRLVDVPASAVEIVHTSSEVQWLTVSGDGLWMRAGGETASRVHPGTARIFADFLAGTHDRSLINTSGIGSHLPCTPLVVGGPGGGSPANRGSELDRAVMSRSVDDLTSAAREALLRFVEGDVRICGDDVLFRARPLARIFSGDCASLVPFSDVPSGMACCRPDKVEDVLVAMREIRRSNVTHMLENFLAHVPTRLLADQDVRHYAHTAPAALWTAAQDAFPSVPAQVRTAAAPLMPLIALGSTWAIEPEQYAQALRATSAAFDAMAAASELFDRNSQSHKAQATRDLMRQVEGFAMPRATEAPPPGTLDPADAESLVGLGP